MADLNLTSNSQDASLKLATAIALIKSKLSSSSSSSESDAQRWKRKSKERKRELLILKQQLKDIQDGSERDLVPEIASCKCHFFDDCGKLSARGVNLGGNEGDRLRRIAEVLHRRFLRQVRWRERRKRTEDSVSRRRIALEVNCDDEMERLCTSVDFLVELCDTGSPVCLDFEPLVSNILSILSIIFQRNFYHFNLQLFHFDLHAATLKNLIARKRDSELLEEIVRSLILRLIRRMCTSVESGGTENFGFDAQSCVQHIIRKLGSEPFIGQRTMLLVSQKLCVLSDCLLLMDPFDDAFPSNHCSMYMMIQLIEFLISDYVQTWTSNEDFENSVFEEWVRAVVQVKKALNLFESRNGLYMLFMDRVIGELLKQVGIISRNGVLDMDILDDLFH